jgi:two-component system LytT family response regulator
MIVDDDRHARERLRLLAEEEGDIEIVCECSNGREAVDALARGDVELVFLDVEMPLLDGFGVLAEVGADRMPPFIFTSAFSEFAVRAFEAYALDYLLKPFDDARFRATMARVRRRHGAAGSFDRQGALAALLEQLERGARLPADAQPRVLAEAGSRMHMLDVSQVEVVEADRNYVRLTIGRETFHARSTLQQAEKSFQTQPMLRISRSCLVNMRHVREVSRTPRGDFILVLSGGTTVTSSEGYREPVRHYLERLKLAPA